jgi:hypothetical protein
MREPKFEPGDVVEWIRTWHDAKGGLAVVTEHTEAGVDVNWISIPTNSGLVYTSSYYTNKHWSTSCWKKIGHIDERTAG